MKTSNICSGRQQNVNISSNSSDSDGNNWKLQKKVLKYKTEKLKFEKMFQASGDEEFTQLLSMTTNYPSWHGEFKEMIQILLNCPNDCLCQPK